MGKRIVDQFHTLHPSNSAHILYYSHDQESYIQNAIDFIAAGIEREDQVLFVENERIGNLIKKKLASEQLAKVHFINNFDFYWQNGDFHPPTILSYFFKTLEPYSLNNKFIRTWGHVEWGDEKEIQGKLEEFENEVHKRFPGEKIIAVCAYDAVKMTEQLKEGLLRCHGFLMTDDDLYPIAN